MKKPTIAAILLTALMTIPAVAQEPDRTCGSVEKFNQTKRWEDLPGCLELTGADYDNPALVLLARAKNNDRDFFYEWSSGGNRGDSPSGAVSSYEFRIKKMYDDDAWRSLPQVIAAKPAFDEMKRIAESHLALTHAYLLIMELKDTVGTLHSFTIGLVEREGEDPGAALFALKNAQDAMDKVVAAGLPDSMIICNCWWSKRTFSLAETKAALTHNASIVNKLANSSKAADEAKWKPFTDVLKGDRLMLFKKYEVGILQGVSGRTLRTPADFRTSTFYAKYTNGRSGILNRWNMTIWRFRGDKIVATQTKSGWGDDPPTTAFR